MAHEVVADVEEFEVGWLGRAGCTRMVQGGDNAVLTPPDSLEAHLLDALRGGAWLFSLGSWKAGRVRRRQG